MDWIEITLLALILLTSTMNTPYYMSLQKWNRKRKMAKKPW